MSKALALLILVFTQTAFSQANVFRFHLSSEPSSLRPSEQRNSSAGYFFSSVTSSLMSYQDKKLSGNLAEKCSYQNDTKITCTLKKEAKWPDSSPIKPEHFKNAFLKILNPENKSFQADLLFPLKNAKAYYQGKAKESAVGITAQKNSISFELENPNREFIYILASPILSPIPESGVPGVEEIQKNPSLHKSSGPYQIDSWDPLKKITLKSNPHYWKKGARPQIEILFVSEDSVAVSLYESGKLDLLRRLPTAFISKYKNTSEFFEIDQFRFDYLGFAPRLQTKENDNLRRAVAQAIDYSELQKLYVAKSPPGCPGILKNLYQEEICIEFNKDKAIAAFEKVKEKPKDFTLMYSKQGGDDHKRSMEWIQGKLKENLGFSISAVAMEDKIYSEKLKSEPPDLFRRGVAPPRPTCLAALETFRSEGLDNFINFKSEKFDGILAKLLVSKSENEKKKLCSEGIHLLMDDFRLIPTGRLYFTLLAKPSFRGWKLNELNQLDLSELSPRK